MLSLLKTLSGTSFISRRNFSLLDIFVPLFTKSVYPIFETPTKFIKVLDRSPFELLFMILFWTSLILALTMSLDILLAAFPTPTISLAVESLTLIPVIFLRASLKSSSALFSAPFFILFKCNCLASLCLVLPICLHLLSFYVGYILR